MLTIRKIRIAAGDTAAARRTAGYVLDPLESPAYAATALDPGEGSTIDAHAGPVPAARWLGTPRMLEQLGVDHGTAVEVTELSLALQGRNVRTGERLRAQGMLKRVATDARGRPVVDAEGHPVTERVRGTKSVDLTFSAPKSVSIVWSHADARLRAEIEDGMLRAAAAMLESMTLSKPVVAHHGALHHASGFASAAALHVFARASRSDPVPAPQLHVHGIVVGVERGDGLFAAPELAGMFRHGAPLEGGAVARLRLAECLADTGFEIRNRGRFFEIGGVPAGLIERLSARTRDVDSSIRERASSRGTPLTNVERSMAALMTRPPKHRQPPLDATVAAWRRHADDFDFGPAAIDAIRTGQGFADPLSSRCARVDARPHDDVDQQPEALTPRTRARFFEEAAGRLRLAEAWAVLDPVS